MHGGVSRADVVACLTRTKRYPVQSDDLLNIVPDLKDKEMMNSEFEKLYTTGYVWYDWKCHRSPRAPRTRFSCRSK